MFLRNLVTVLKRSNNSVFSATQNCQQLRTLRTKTVSTVVALTTKNKKPAIQANSSPKEENDLVINWEAEIDDMVADETSKSILAPVENPSNIDVEPTILPTFNFAAYVSKSETLQQFVKLGVDLSRLEKRKGIAKYILNLDFERDMKGHLMFLTKDINISPDYLSWFLTKNPLIFKESIVDLQTRINYLESKRFSKDEIAAIVSRNPYWLMFSTLRMDRRLGFFQREFGLSGNQMRHLTNILPKLITDKLEPIREIKFAVLEEMGFDKDQTKELLLKTPQIWLLRKFSFCLYGCFLCSYQLLST